MIAARRLGAIQVFIVLNVRVTGLRRGKPFDSPAQTRADE